MKQAEDEHCITLDAERDRGAALKSDDANPLAQFAAGEPEMKNSIILAATQSKQPKKSVRQRSQHCLGFFFHHTKKRSSSA